VGRITSEFPLSAWVIMALLSASFVLMFLMILDSVCVCVCVCVMCLWVLVVFS